MQPLILLPSISSLERPCSAGNHLRKGNRMKSFKIKECRALEPEYNVRITAFDIRTGKVSAVRETHNVLTNVGRTWLRDLVSTTSYADVDANGGQVPLADSKSNERPRFVGFGVGSVLTSDPTLYYGTQEELPAVTAPEDWVKVSDTDYLKELNAQTLASSSFPDASSVVYILDIAESEISFAGNTSKSGQAVGTDVAVTEVGLYLSGADETANPDDADNTSRMVAYNIFSPVHVTPNVVLRVEWEFLF